MLLAAWALLLKTDTGRRQLDFPTLFISVSHQSGFEIIFTQPFSTQRFNEIIMQGSVADYFLTAQQSCWLPHMEKFEFPESFSSAILHISL